MTELDFARAALLTIDVQRDFYEEGAPAEIAGTRERLPQMRRAVAAFRAARRPVVHVVRLYLPDGSNAEPVRLPLLASGLSIVAPGTPGSQVAADLLPDPRFELDPRALLDGELQPVGDQEWVMYKPRWGAFYRTRLEEHLHDLGVETVVVAGCNWPNCPRTTLYEASERDFGVALVTDALSGLHEQGVGEARGIGTSLLTSEQVEAALLPAAVVPVRAARGQLTATRRR